MVRRIVALASLAVCAAGAPAVLIVVHLDQTEFVVNRGDFVEVTGWVENITGAPVILSSALSADYNGLMTSGVHGVGGWWGGTKPTGIYYAGVLGYFEVLMTSPYFTSTDFAIGPGLAEEGAKVPYTVTVEPVPEPASLAALGIGALALTRRRPMNAARR
jgi:hypothetical protein